MPSYEDSMRAKFRGENAYSETLSIESDEVIVEETINENGSNNCENNEDVVLNAEENNIHKENVDPAKQTSLNSNNKFFWNGIDIDKISATKNFLVSDQMFDLVGAGIGLIIIITAIYKIIIFGYEELYLYFSLFGFALMIMFAVKNRMKKTFSKRKRKSFFQGKTIQ
jgi:hypothetical protein